MAMPWIALYANHLVQLLVALLLIGWLSKGRFGEGMPETSMMKEVFELKICAFALGALSCGGGAARVGCAGQARLI